MERAQLLCRTLLTHRLLQEGLHRVDSRRILASIDQAVQCLAYPVERWSDTVVAKPHPANLTMVVSHPISISLNSSASSANSTFLISKDQAPWIWTTATSIQSNQPATKIHTWQPSTVTVWLGTWVAQEGHLALTSPVEVDPLIIIPNKALTYRPTSFSTSHLCLQTVIHPRWSNLVAKTSAQEAKVSDLWVDSITRV